MASPSRRANRQRGVYSDFAGPAKLSGAQSKPSRRQQMFASPMLPSARSFPKPPSESKPNGRHKPGRAESAAPLPKVQTPYEVPSGEVPRKVEIERRRRIYIQKDIETLLAARGVGPADVIPGGCIQASGAPGAFLPLEFFDDVELDARAPEEWVALVAAAPPGGIPATGVRERPASEAEGAAVQWAPCKITGYDAAAARFVAEFEGDGAGGAANPASVPRIHLLFAGEDPEAFADRVAAAVQLRTQTEMDLQYHLYIDCMPDPDTDVGTLIPLDRLRSSLDAPRDSPVVEALVEEVNLDYGRAHNRMLFDATVTSAPAEFPGVSIPQPTGVPGLEPPPRKRVDIGVPSFDVPKAVSRLKSLALCVNKDVIRTLCEIATESSKVAHMSLYNTKVAKCVRLEEFELMQTQASDFLHGYLKNTWVPTIRSIVSTNLGGTGKGWFNLNESSQRVYDQSKLHAFFQTTKLIMQDTLRTVISDSLLDLTRLVEHAAKSVTGAASLEWGDDGFVSDRFKPQGSPLFSLDVVYDEEAGKFSLSTPVGPFEEAVLQLFEKGIEQTSGLLDIEPLVMKQMFFVGTPTLNTVDAREPWVSALKQRIAACIQTSAIPLLSYLDKFNEHLELAGTNVQEYVAAFQAEEREAVDVKRECLMHTRSRDDILKAIPTSVSIGLFHIGCDKIRALLADKRKTMYTAVLDILARQCRKQADRVCSEFVTMSRKIYEKPNGIEELTDQRQFLKSIPDKTKELQISITRAISDWDLLADFECNLSDSDSSVKWIMFGWPKKLAGQLDAVTESLNADATRFEDNLVSDQKEFEERIESLKIIVAGFSQYDDASKTDTVSVEVRKLANQLKETQQDAQTYNLREKLFGRPVTDYDQVGRLVKEFDPYKNLWVTADDWKKHHHAWMHDSFTNLDPEALEAQVNGWGKTIAKTVRAFRDLEGCRGVAEAVRGWIEEFQPYVPLIQALRNPGMRERHWTQLSDSLGFSVQPDETFTFAACLGLKLEDHIDVIAKVGNLAGKEFSIEQALDKMEAEWAPVELEIRAYKETGTYIMKSADEVSQLLDDHIVMTQAMSFSPFKKPFEGRIMTWENKLRVTQDVIEEWLTCQRNWLYLEPIFSSDDIARQLPTESKRYQNMDRLWRKSMDGAHRDPSVIGYCSNVALLEAFKECNKLLDQVQKGLSAYLETKRNAFPRFYFLSDDELLEILSQTKDPTAVQPHMRKCFDNIARLRFEDDLRMSEFISADKEAVAFCEDLYPRGNVEDWLLEVERVMRVSLRDIFVRAKAAYAEQPRAEWVLNWPGQIVIAGSQTYWTAEAEEAIPQEGGLQRYFDKMVGQLKELVMLVRSKLNRVQRKVMSALIVIEVHAQEVVGKLLAQKVDRVSAFEWISQLRYYWEDDAEGATDLRVKAVTAVFNYGYEYLGNSGRLVITPLTDRCYLTLTGALALIFGGAPAGPAGTGKTESVKDLAKAMAIQCVVFNCSDQLDYMAMGKFFKGLASAGAWACFDEFNRIDIEVLSVVAQQVSTIQQAIKNREKRFFFEGVDLSLRWTCAAFITMNPGYAGRTELPDNLAALFRPVAMMVPDYAMIAEIMLYSFGFSDGRPLSKKITTVFKLSSEQLSSQDHYDFGMRAVKTVISAAGNLKQTFPEMPEDVIVLRAIREVNVPKFLLDDLTLFNGIVSDLFPHTQLPPVDYGAFEVAIRDACRAQGLQTVDGFVTKVIQLYETTVVRHGLMLVGPAGSGKTRCYEVLAAALTSLKGQSAPSGAAYTRVLPYVLNPKAITMGQLYGEFDALTHEWTDGILSTLIRRGVAAQTDDKKWFLFDGPVDAIWIENMNTVLDDNKKLCLASGEIIALTPEMRMIFEVADLTVASPATVSRCGMVYLEPSILGLDPFIVSWLEDPAKVPPLVAAHAGRLRALFDAFLAPAIDFVRRHLREIVATMDSNLCFSLLRMLQCFFAPFVPAEGVEVPERIAAAIPALIEPWFLFSLVWTLGATCDNEGRAKFDAWLRERTAAGAPTQAALPFPAEGLVFDYRLREDGSFGADDGDGGNGDGDGDGDGDDNRDSGLAPAWVRWTATMPEFVVQPGAEFSELIVPTIDTIRYSHLLELLVGGRMPVLCVGPTGTAKSLTISNKLLRAMPTRYLSNFIVFSARTSANQTQDMVDAKLDKRRKGIYGPPLGKVYVQFIDDLNMPALEEYGAQPPIEILRQYMDHGGWYDRKAIGAFRRLVDLSFVCAMGPPGGGRNPVTPRFKRHFNFLAFTDLQDESKATIFRPIVASFLRSFEGGAGLADGLVASTIRVYNAIRQGLLPTPAKVHYTFNLRDLSKVFQGVLMADLRKAEARDDVLRLWVHECSRVFDDRLINAADRAWFRELLEGELRAGFGAEWAAVVPREPLFGDFGDPTADVRRYVELPDLARVRAVMEEALDDYNAATSAPMKLVLFEDAVRHAAKISRVIRQPMGNALCLGVGGSGRQSMTRLAAFMADFECFQIELAKNYGVAEWREDLRALLRKAGKEDQKMVFLFSDTQIKSESFLEDINSVLNTGDVPGIYEPAEMDEIYAAMKPVVQGMGMVPSKANLMSVYCGRVRANLHTVVCMSPIGDVFRARLRQFPALVNNCTIDWFSAWPDEALRSVAHSFLAELPELDGGVDGIVGMCVGIHQSVVARSAAFERQLGRINYVTPTSYLELLGIFSRLLGSKKADLQAVRDRTATGLAKLLSTAKEVAGLQDELTEMQPMLKQAAEETEATMVRIAADKEIAQETAAQVGTEEKEAAAKAAETKAIADDAQRDLDEALPALDAALASLKSLNKGDITEVKAMSNPPKGVKLVMEAVCIMQGVKPKMVAGERPGQKVADYWAVCGPLLQNPQKFLDSLFKYDKENIPDRVIAKISPYIDNPDFTPAAIAKVSKACTSVCTWVRAMHKYHNVAKNVAPKRAALKAANESLQRTLKQLDDAKARLQGVRTRIADMETKFAAMTAKKQQLEDKARECTTKLARAEKLIALLGDEKVRWRESVQVSDQLIASAVGDMVVSAGTVAYLGPFTSEFRAALAAGWREALREFAVPHTAEGDLVTTLSDPVEVREWQLCGLPNDQMSVENACVVKYSQRWPLFIDPQAQANKWIRQREADKLVVMKLTDRDFLRSLENAVRFGSPCLLENVGEELDPALEPILLRQVFKQGGTMVIKLGDSTIPYHDDFRFYITTKLPNPHYTPEVSTKVTVVNFTLSPSGLEDQMLGLVVAQERPDLEEAKNALIVSNAQMKAELQGIEDTILRLLSESTGSPVDDEDLINALEASKVKSAEIQTKVKVAEETERDIDETRSKYVPVAVRTQLLFFCTTDLAHVDPMYQYSLGWYRGIFLNGVDKAEPSDDVETRIANIISYFTFSLYSNVCRSLFERHKLLFSFLLCCRVLMNEGRIDMDEWRYFTAGGTTAPEELPNPAPDWVSERAWKDIQSLAGLPAFAEFARDFPRHLAGFRRIFDAAEPHREPLPGGWGERLDAFQRILVLRCIRYDMVSPGMQDFVAAHLGQRFIEPQTANLGLAFAESSPTVPMIFVLSTGTDPAADLYAFAEEMRFTKKLSSISLGQGQGPRAEAMFKSAMERGTWVFFQNCHLAPSWMPTLERLIENIDSTKVHRDFRLWLTSMPSPKFPVAVLQNGAKMTVEPPRGIKANLLAAFDAFDDDYLAQCEKQPAAYRALLFSLCLFHGVILERRKFGSLGFNIRYGYTKSDLQICLTQLNLFLSDYDTPPFKVLTYTAGHINYGGRVTDDWDRRCQMTILEDYYNDRVLQDGHEYSASGTYSQPKAETFTEYLDYIKSLPINDTPEIFGLHDNANITFANNETSDLLAGILATSGSSGGGGGGGNRDKVIEETAVDIKGRIPAPIDLELVMKAHPVKYEESMNTVLIQEVIRFNKLLVAMHGSLGDVLKALKGLVVMSEALEKMANSLFVNQVPDLWSAKAYPSLKPLGAWVSDLLARVRFIQRWIDEGIPPAFWISGFYFPQAFLTGTLQNYARKHVVSIDTLGFDFQVVEASPDSFADKPEDGCYIYGVYVEGARWDPAAGVLQESHAKELYTQMSPIWLKPVANRTVPEHGMYVCPCYKTLQRAGMLSTTGHSTNFVLSIELPSDRPQHHWIKRAVALICALDY